MQPDGYGARPTAQLGGREEWPSPSEKDDSFFIYQFKVTPCNKHFVHDWSCCPFAHTNERARRRDPRTHAGLACPAMKQDGRCPRGDACAFSHTSWEFWLHPARYKTALCSLGDKCQRRFCFFAHSISELRTQSGLMGWGTQKTGAGDGRQLPCLASSGTVLAAPALGGGQQMQQCAGGIASQGDGSLPAQIHPNNSAAGLRHITVPALGSTPSFDELGWASAGSSDTGLGLLAGLGLAGGATMPLQCISGRGGGIPHHLTSFGTAIWPLSTLPTTAPPPTSHLPPPAEALPLQPAAAASFASPLGPSTPQPPDVMQPSPFRESHSSSHLCSATEEGFSMAVLLDALREELSVGGIDFSTASSLLAHLLPQQRSRGAWPAGASAVS